MRRRLVLLLAAASVLLAAADAVASDVNPGPLLVDARSQNVPGVAPGTVNLSIECAAAIVPLGAVSITDCYLLGEDGTRLSMASGHPSTAPADVQAFTVANARLQPYRPCVEARGTVFGDLETTHEVALTFCAPA